MTDTHELDDLITQARARGAMVTVIYDDEVMRTEGRRLYETIQVSGLRGVGPFPMSPISAAEALRPAVYNALHGLCRHGNQEAFCYRCKYAGR